MIAVLFFQLIPSYVAATESSDSSQQETNTWFVFAESPEQTVDLFEEENAEQWLATIPDDTEVEVLEAGDEYSYIRYTSIENEQATELTGYVSNAYLVQIDDAEAFRQQRNQMNEQEETDQPASEKHGEETNLNEGPSTQIEDEEEKLDKEKQPDSAKVVEKKSTSEKVNTLSSGQDDPVTEEQEVLQGVAMQQPTTVYTELSTKSKTLKSYRQGHVLKFQAYDDNWFQATVYMNGEPQTGFISNKDVKLIAGQEQLEGLALKQPINVYDALDRQANVLKKYKYGQLLKYRTLTEDWYQATVIINGKAQSGFITVDDVGDEAPVAQGIALNKTNIYEQTAKGSKVLKAYDKGQVLKYRAFNGDWYEATVYINGTAKTGYIHKSDVETAVFDEEIVQGIAVKASTPVYSAASTNSAPLKSYQQGSILKYKTFTSGWYKATVMVNGKAKTGYIAKADVGSKNATLTGYAQANKTKVYQGPSKSAKTWKSYGKGSILKYKYYNSSWFQVTVIVNGKKQTGYIHTKDVGGNAPLVRGFAYSNPTRVYSDTSKSASVWKTYPIGQSIQYRPYNNEWYKVTVYVNGKAQTGYIHAKDAGTTAPLIKGFAYGSPTNIYSSTAKSSKVLKNYARGSALQYRPHNSDWYKATVYVNGKARTGYIHKNDVGLSKPKPIGNTNIVNPNRVYTYNHMVQDIKALQRAYPDLITYHSIGKSEYGRDIYAISIGKGKPTAFINGSHHGREWLTTNLNMYMVEQYAKAYYKKQKIQGYDTYNLLNKTTLWFVPMVNPDGVTLQQEGLKAFPKSVHASLIKMNEGSTNFKRWKANGKGVDLNRQYDAGWKTIRNNAKGPSYANFKGYSPASASEIKAILKFEAKIDPEIAVAYHSSGKILYWNYLQTGADYGRDLALAQVISKMTGYSLYKPVGIPSGGGYTDWFIQAHKRPGFTPEISKWVNQTNPPLSEFPGAWRENQAVGLYVAQESAKLYAKRK